MSVLGPAHAGPGMLPAGHVLGHEFTAVIAEVGAESRHRRTRLRRALGPSSDGRQTRPRRADDRRRYADQVAWPDLIFITITESRPKLRTLTWAQGVERLRASRSRHDKVLAT